MKKILCWLFPSITQALHGEGYQEAIRDILVFKDKIYTGTVLLPGDQKTVTNCTFLGNEVGLTIVNGPPS